MTQEEIIELREAAYDYAHLIQIENFDRHDVAVHRAYERLRMALGEPIGMSSGRPSIIADAGVTISIGASNTNEALKQ